MFDIAPSELMLVGAVALVVIGPKDLPRAMRFVGQWVGRARGMARHFRMGIDEIIRQSELEEMQKKWAAENARIMAEHPMPAPAEEADDAAYAYPNDVHVMTPLPSPSAEASAEGDATTPPHAAPVPPLVAEDMDLFGTPPSAPAITPAPSTEHTPKP
ncbi:Sec-independent protein translocase protein TatB [Sphingomonas sp. MMS24-J13]|uniref:Sec-independent protein translocase protein TatB n=1 Tax=Sphingomonas sp. MMS24-J13 TaxID=3238686 RepID=UPI00384ABF26